MIRIGDLCRGAFVFGLLFLGPVALADAQIEKTFERSTMNGRTVQAPYVTYEEFQSATIRSSEGHAPLRKLLTVSSVETVTELLGKPQSVERTDDPDDESFTVWLHYKGDTTVEYHGFADGTLGLTSLDLQSSEWSLTVGGTTFRPNANVSQLNSALRTSLDLPSGAKAGKENDTRTEGIYIADPDASKDGAVTPLKNGMTQVGIKARVGSGTIESVYLSRIPSN